MFRTYRMLSTGKGAVAAGTVMDLDQRTAQLTPAIFQVCLSGTTAQRPKAGDADFSMGVQAGIFYLDTTLTKVIVSDGNNLWRDPTSGSAV